jgi:hypothetical protein
MKKFRALNLRTGEYLGPSYTLRVDAENCIKVNIALEWAIYERLQENTRYLVVPTLSALSTSYTTTSYYMGQPYNPPQNKLYHFEIIEVEE